MKTKISFKDRILRGTPMAALCACVVLAGASPVFAGESPKTIVPADEENFANWVDVGTGTMIYKGNKAEGQQRTQQASGMFGGINDMHLEQTLGNKWFAKLDGHAIFGENDYDLRLDISKPDVGYIRAGYKEFRSFYNGMGGFYPNDKLSGGGRIFNPLDDELYVDRGDVWAELGLRVPSLPEITIRYDHLWRDGTKDSTIWGDTARTGSNMVNPNNLRKIVPAFRDLHEQRDIFTADVKKTIGNTDLGVGARAEFSNSDDSLNLLLRPGEYNPTLVSGKPLYNDVKLDRYVTQEDTMKTDLFSTHATTETRFGEKLWLTSAYEFSTLNSDIGGSRIYGQDYDSAYHGIFGATAYRNPTYPVSLQYLPLAATSGSSAAVGGNVSTRAAASYIDLLGGSEMHRHEFNVNLMWIPIPQISILTGFLFDSENTDSVSTYTLTNTNYAKAYYLTTVRGRTTTNPITYLQPTQDPGIATSDYAIQRAAENLEVRFTGLKDWVLYTRCDLDEEMEYVQQFQKNAILITQTTPTSSLQVPGTLSSGTTTLKTAWESPRLTQKYSTGFNWYPLPRLSFSGQYYHKYDNTDFTNTGAGKLTQQDAYFINNQNFSTDDMNFRVTTRPLSNLSLVSRYDFQRITSYTAADELQSQECATQTNNMFTECATWTPLDRLYLQGNFSYVVSNTETPAAITIQDPTYYTTAGGVNTAPAYKPGNPLIGPVGLSCKNDYWTLGLGVGYALDDKTDLRADYIYYRANNYSNDGLFDNAVVISQPYGVGQEENTVSLSMQRQLCRNARLTLKYAYTTSRDDTSYGYGNFNAHLISTSLLVRF